MELITITPEIDVLQGPTNIGIIKGEGNKAIVVDTGLDESAGRKVLRALQEMALSLEFVITTHAHADHFGGNAFLARRTGCKVITSELESYTLKQPILEPVGLYGGVIPPPSLRYKFLLAPFSPVDIIVSDGPLTLCGRTLDIIRLPGHTTGQIGVMTSDVILTGDAFFVAGVLEKHRVPFVTDVAQSRMTLKKLKTIINGRRIVPGHGRPEGSVEQDLEANLDKYDRIEGLILKNLIQMPMTTEQLTAKIAECLDISLERPDLYYLYQAAIKAFLVSLVDANAVSEQLEGNVLYWTKL